MKCPKCGTRDYLKVMKGVYGSYLKDDFDGAIKYWEEAGKVIPGAQSFAADTILIHKGKLRDALAMMGKNKPQPDKIPGQRDFLIGLGKIFMQYGRPEDARQKFRRSFQCE
jgi:hypothetical protein